MRHYSTWVAVFFSMSIFSSKDHTFCLWSWNRKITNPVSRKEKQVLIHRGWIPDADEASFSFLKLDNAVGNASYHFALTVWKERRKCRKGAQQQLFQCLDVASWPGQSAADLWGCLSGWKHSPVRGWGAPSQMENCGNSVWEDRVSIRPSYRWSPRPETVLLNKYIVLERDPYSLAACFNKKTPQLFQ